MTTLAAIATIPGRPLERVLASLRPQVDILAVYLNGFRAIDIPDAMLARYGCWWQWEPERAGSSKKLYWADKGVADFYFACDDDLEYPPDYVETLTEEWLKWDELLFVTACGRIMRPGARRWRDWEGDGAYISAVPKPRWINYLGGCAFMFHTSLALPTIDLPNEEEAILSVWAQQHQIPIRQVAHPYDWPKRIPLTPGSFTLYHEAHREGFRTRSEIIQRVKLWNVYEPKLLGLPVVQNPSL